MEYCSLLKVTHSCTECICGLAAAVTDLLQSVELEYNGYQGDDKASGAKNEQQVKEHLNGLFSLFQGLGGTAVVRTYIDQLAQVLSALVGWSRIETCGGNKGQAAHGTSKCNGGGKNGNKCFYLNDVKRENRSCDTCGCIKGGSTEHLGKGCTKCSSGSSTHKCSNGGSGGSQCAPGHECQCALAGKCCKCYCKDMCGCKKECSCDKGDYIILGRYDDTKKTYGHREHKDSYMSAYSETVFESYIEGTYTVKRSPMWNDLSGKLPGDKKIIGLINGTASQRRHQCARILLGSVCLIWSGLTYMYWTGKRDETHKTSPRWNNHILDGSGLDDGTLSQWLQALGFPRDMLNNHGTGNRLDAVIWDGLRDRLFLGFDPNQQFNKDPTMNLGGFIHEINKAAFNDNVFKENVTDNNNDQHKRGALFKLYILSCAYFTGLQQKAQPKADNKIPRTIREILYWLSALPYSPAYQKLVEHCKDLQKKKGVQQGMKFSQHDKTFTVRDVDFYSHFQAVTQYCPLVLIGIQGGLKGTDSTKEPAIHALYANTACGFTYPTVSIQAYNQVVHYIRALFYQLYFLRKQCAVKVALGGKWRECRYGDGVVSKGVISWMCLGCNPMEHDRKWKVGKVKGELVGVENELKRLYYGVSGTLSGSLKKLLEAIGDVMVQLGNAQEALERKKTEEIKGVKTELEKAKTGLRAVVGIGSGSGALKSLEESVKALKDRLDGKVKGLEKVVEEKVMQLEKMKNEKALKKAQGRFEKVKNAVDKLKDAKTALDGLTKGGSSGGILGKVVTALQTATNGKGEVDPCKNELSKAISKVREVVNALQPLKDVLIEAVKNDEVIEQISDSTKEALIYTIKDLTFICNSPKCSACQDHSKKCGQPSKPTVCPTCHQPTTTGVPSPLQAFLEDRLPGFSCEVVRGIDDENPMYPPAASHLHHSNSPGQCCPLPMGFRGQFHKGSISDMTGKRLYGILYFFSNENMMESCAYRLVRVTAALSATTPQVLGDVFGFFRGGVGNPLKGKTKKDTVVPCDHSKDPSNKGDTGYFCGWCASGLRDEVKGIQWIPKEDPTAPYRDTVGDALIAIKGDKDTVSAVQYASATTTTPNNLSTLTDGNHYVSPLTGELYTAVSATFGGTYLSWVLYLSDALEGGLKSLSEAFRNIECRGCRECDPNKCKKGEHGQGSGQCQCQSIVSCTGVLPVLYRHGFSYGNPFNLEGFQQENKDQGDYSIEKKDKTVKHCHEFLSTLSAVIEKKEAEKDPEQHPLTELLKQVGQLQYDIRLPWIFVLTVAWLVAVLYLAFGAIWPLDWTHMRSHWLRGGEHQWQCMWYKVMTGRKGRVVLEGVDKYWSTFTSDFSDGLVALLVKV